MTAEATTLWHRLWYTRLRDLLRGQIDGSLSWRQLIAAEDLPANVRGLIELVIGRTRLWRREKVDVARELIAHFQDGLEAGSSPEQLVASFGDPQQAARLIRRAKKRCRPLVWYLTRYACWAILVLLTVYAGMRVFLLTGRPIIRTDYLEIINERANSVPEVEQAWPLYRRALAQILIDRKFPEWLEHFQQRCSNYKPSPGPSPGPGKG